MIPAGPIRGILCTIIACGLASCSGVQESAQSKASLPPLTFALDGVSNFRVAGVPLYGQSKLDIDGARETLTAFAAGEFPVSFILNVTVTNPDRSSEAGDNAHFILSSLSWTLSVDGIPTIDGDIPQPITIPTGGQPALVPIWIRFDLLRFLKDRGYDSLVALAFQLGGAHGSARRLVLHAKPTLKTDEGEYLYPGEVEIVVRGRK